MKKVVTILLIIFSVFTVSFSASATLITYSSYSYDDNTNIVTGNGLEWLRWDETDGISINTALSLYSGWRLATNEEMAELFNAFVFGAAFVWDSDENTQQSQSNNDGFFEEPDDPELVFISMFGNTYEECPWTSVINPCVSANALFGTDPDNDGLYNVAQVADDYWYTGDGYVSNGHAILRSDYSFPNTTADLRNVVLGVALVRAVPEPQALLWFALGLWLLAGRNQLAKRFF